MTKKERLIRKRLAELERQLREYTEEDYLREAEKMEREMTKQQVDFEPPEGFFDQVIAKGKLLWAEQKYDKRKDYPEKNSRRPDIQ